MHSISQLEKQQVRLRLPKYLVEEIDAFTNQFSIKRTLYIYSKSEVENIDDKVILQILKENELL